jgi:adenine/guanine phosphoribosyltransferase-like PRPP-binding protein
MTAVWSGAWVAERFGLAVTGQGGASAVRDLVGLALRRNERRAHLLVSTVLGKHVPADPRLVHATGIRLGALAGEQVRGASLVLGYAETATGLGHLVADALGADYLHSTRRQVAGVEPMGGFEEEHSHATSHLLLPEDPTLLCRPGPLVLVDDELSTGRTALNTIAALHALRPREQYVIATLVDLRSASDVARLAATAAALDARIDVVALATARIEVPDQFPADAAQFVAGHTDVVAGGGAAGSILRAGGWPAGVRDGGRHGFGAADRLALRDAADRCAAQLAGQVTGARVLVLGFEELMYAPLMIARGLGDSLGPRASVRFSATTRSPVLAIDAPGYPIRTRLAFPSHDDPAGGPGQRFAYNVAPAADAQPLTDVVVVVDDVADTAELHSAGGLLAQLAGSCERVHLLVLPSYRPARVLTAAP